MLEKRLEESLSTVYEKIYNDLLIDTMKQDPASQEFISLRVKEIISDNLNNEKEIYISRLSNKNFSI